jgi:hypothetical protein
MAVKKRQTFKPATTYSFRQLEELWIGAGGNRLEAPYAAAIALAESKGNPNAEGHNKNGTVDRGLWQINSVHGSLSTTNVAANAKAAVQIHNESGGWGPWVTYKTGAYKAYLTPKNLLSGVKAGEAIEPLSGLAGPLEGKIPLVSKEGKAEEAGEKALEAVGKFSFSWEGLSSFALKLVLLLVGAVLFGYGIMVAVRPRESAFSLPKLSVPVVG